MRPARVIVALAAFCTGAAALHSADTDWPQWRGPARTGLSTETGLLKSWPKDGPTLAWRIEGLGKGYSTPTVTGGKIYILGTKEADGKEQDVLIALTEKDGSRLWDLPIGPTQDGGGFPGPRCSPTVDGDRVYALGAAGRLVCADISKGSVHWEKDLTDKKGFAGRIGGWKYSESPLIDGDVLVCTPGGPDASIVALNKKSGETIWKSKIQVQGKGNYGVAMYSSAVVATIGGVKQYVQFMVGGVVGVDAKDGKLLWHYDRPANGTANCSTPIVKGDAVFAASSYGTGGGRADIVKTADGFEAKQAYFLKELQNHHGGMVLVGDHVFGTGSGSLYCVDFKTGEIAWENKSVGKGSVVYADGHLYVRSEAGPVALVEANPEKYVEKGRFKQLDRTKGRAAWPHPVVVNGKLYLHDWDKLFCYDVKAK
jgi:outer membrane protein assembly factor BamB